ncbi:hypothetical protein [Streptomyces spiramyceticus]|uniref:hypothetical protein n=1 Tax=Streptomyces spiramyceticus TaxID=299717 RepID=UPI00237C1D59|nr:hypothetical protein [Streptomyces spiramyceticus]
MIVDPERVRAVLEEAGGAEYAQLGDVAALAALGALAIVDPGKIDAVKESTSEALAMGLGG